MLFDLVSDLHADIQETVHWHKAVINLPWVKLRNNGSRVLAIVGDTANSSKKAMAVIREAARVYEHVVFVDGNHEHYNNRQDLTTVAEDMRYLHDEAEKLPNVTFLDGRSSLLIGGTLFIGCNGWYDFEWGLPASHQEQIRAWFEGSNDCHNIRFEHYREAASNRPDIIISLAELMAENLVIAVQAAAKRDDVREIVVLTHTVPVARGLSPYEPAPRIGHAPMTDARPDREREWNALSGAYGNSRMSRVLDANTAGKIKVWCFGHVHTWQDFEERGVWFVARPRGYYNRSDRGNVWTGPLQVDTQARPWAPV